MNWQLVVKEKMLVTVRLYLMVFIPMWMMYVLNSTILFGLWNHLGIQPRTFAISSFIGVFASWTMHGNLSHIIGNSLILLQILFVFSLLEKKPFIVIAQAIVLSGVLTWLLGGAHSIHVGASGLVFALFGFILGRIYFGKQWQYLVVCIFLGFEVWAAMFQGLIPQHGISFAGHFGGLCAGLFMTAQSKQKSITWGG